jgi:hypothetical protein
VGCQNQPPPERLLLAKKNACRIAYLTCLPRVEDDENIQQAFFIGLMIRFKPILKIVDYVQEQGVL